LLEIRKRYFTVPKLEKKQILNEFCVNCGYNRKYAIRLINSKDLLKKVYKRPGRKKKYHHPEIIEFIKFLWISTNLICSIRLKAAIPIWLPFYPKYLADERIDLLTSISASTIDRILRKIRGRYKKLGFSTTKPGSLLKKHIPIKTNQWEETSPGFVEADTISHCGSSVAGQYVNTVQIVDIFSGWSVARASWGKGERGVFEALRSIEISLPFKIKGFDSDNGNEFLNRNLLKYFLNKRPMVSFTRSRPYQKNDNAHIEQKNWTNIRQYLGYERFDDLKITDMLNKLYANEWGLFFNLFLPSVKLVDKTRVGSKIVKEHDAPKTPYQRLIGSDKVSRKTKKQLKSIFERQNPFLLQQSIKKQVLDILSLVKRKQYPSSIN
ncbi:MAG: integrase, partial [Nanoarchaeota archaeon]